jgi:hypothetical protein
MLEGVIGGVEDIYRRTTESFSMAKWKIPGRFGVQEDKIDSEIRL